MYKHYIRINDQNQVTHAFSNAFEDPQETDICLTPEPVGERHFNLSLKTNLGVYKYTVQDNTLVELTKEQLDELEAPIKLAQEKQNRINELTKYLTDTDWYVIRKTERSIDTPPEVQLLRANAVEEINELREGN